MSGIFDRIFRYRQREHSTPRENYFKDFFQEAFSELTEALKGDQ